MLRNCCYFAKCEDGVTAIEYGLIAALIALVIVTAITSIGSNLSSVFGVIASNLSSVASNS